MSFNFNQEVTNENEFTEIKDNVSLSFIKRRVKFLSLFIYLAVGIVVFITF